MDTVAFTAMADGTRQEYAFLAKEFDAHLAGEVGRHSLNLLEAMRGPKLGYRVDRYEHSLQSASRALRDGRDPEYVVCALLHDIGDSIAPYNHSQFAAAVLAPYVSARNAWILRHHGLFQGYYYFHHVGEDRDARERYRDHEWFDACAEFCELYDQCCFDPAHDTLPLEEFVPYVQEVFGRKPWETYPHQPLVGA